MTEQNPERPHPAELALARLRAGFTAGLTVEQSARIQGTTEEELTADATALAAELGAANSTPPGPRTGGPRGVDVNNGAGAGTLGAGAAAYRTKHGLDEDGRRSERPAVPVNGRNPFAQNTYSMNGR
ncbi:hypothetical protein [Streptomyces sp. NPDC056105]|uniref:hypothetical protein n=1 Tax=Streptomyces sp. NPDC056105 TaxID=3345714 RepID=UPI0035E1651D